MPRTGASVLQDEVPRCFDDVFSFFEGQSGKVPTLGAQPVVPTQPDNLLSYAQQAQPTDRPSSSFRGTEAPPASASPGPSAQELNFILKAIQTCVREWPEVQLGGIAERPEQLRKWKFVVLTSLETAGPHMTAWWSWCWQVAEHTHTPSTLLRPS